MRDINYFLNTYQINAIKLRNYMRIKIESKLNQNELSDIIIEV